MTNTLPILFAAVALAGALGASSASAGDRNRQREVVVGCTSTVAHDPGGCRRPARKKCNGDAAFKSVLASTPLARSGLHAVTARYRCLN